jgi:hypothetical protein
LSHMAVHYRGGPRALSSGARGARRLIQRLGCRIQLFRPVDDARSPCPEFGHRALAHDPQKSADILSRRGRCVSCASANVKAWSLQWQDFRRRL